MNPHTQRCFVRALGQRGSDTVTAVRKKKSFSLSNFNFDGREGEMDWSNSFSIQHSKLLYPPGINGGFDTEREIESVFETS